MITWQKTSYGYQLKFSGIITVEETSKWVSEMEKSVNDTGDRFSVFVDMRKSVIIPNECKAMLESIQSHCRTKGMERSVVIISDNVTFQQMTLVAKKTGIYKWERYINSESCPDWNKIGLDWILNGIDPNHTIASAAVSQQTSS